jgi:hypothetical protein
MSQPQTLSELFKQLNTQVRLFDMGRCVKKIAPDEFLAFESLDRPYPTPYLHHAWIAILNWNPKKTDQHAIWFLKWPLDEQGFLAPACRDDFLRRLLLALGELLSQDDQIHEDALGDYPFLFTPTQDRMAYFHALAANVLYHDKSRFYDMSKAYFSGDLGFDNWQELGLQGIADVAIDTDNTKLLASSIDKLPTEVLSAVANCLENIVLPHELATPLFERLERLINTDSTMDVEACIRAVSLSSQSEKRQQILGAVLASPQGRSIEILVAIANRCWEDLLNPELRGTFLLALATNNEGQQAFNKIMSDLVFIPALRTFILADFRNPNKSPALSAAVSGLIQSTRQ